MTQKPRGRVLELRYTTKAMDGEHPMATDAVMGPTVALVNGQDVLEVTFELADENVHNSDTEQTAHSVEDVGVEQTWIPNTDWTPDNPTLLFLAAIGVQPSDVDGGLDVSEGGITVPLMYDQSEGVYGIHGSVLERGQEAIAAAAWNDWGDGSDEDETAQNGDEDDSTGINIETR